MMLRQYITSPIFIAVAALFLMVTATVTMTTNDTSAASSFNVINGTLNSRTAAEQRANGVCADGRLVGFGAWPSNMSLNETTGVFTYTMNVLWKNCQWAHTTAAYAITGYPTQNGLTVCPIAGWYGTGVSNTYDCIKYIGEGSNRYAGQYNLGCINSQNGQPMTGEACVSSPIGREQVVEPNNHPHINPQTKSYVFSQTIPGWQTKKQASGNYVFGADGVLCQFYKLIGRPDREAHKGDCQNFYVRVNWTVPVASTYNLTPTMSGVVHNQQVNASTSKSIYGTVDNNSGNSNSRTNTKHHITKIVFPPGVAMADIDRTGGVSSAAGELPCSYYMPKNAGKYTTCTYDADNVNRAAAYVRNTPVNHTVNTSIGNLADGSKVCYGISVSLYTFTNDARRHSGLRCLIVNNNYLLSPEITNVTDNGTVVTGSSSPITGTVKHSGNVPSRTDTGHRITRIIFAPGTTVNKSDGLSGNVNEYPCNFYVTPTKNSNNGTPNCTTLTIGGAGPIRSAAYGIGTSANYTAPSSIGALREGTIICYGISVSKSIPLNDARRHSALKCVTVKNDFNLVPTVTSVGGGNGIQNPATLNSGTIEFNSGNRTITGTILNDGATRSDRNINYRIYQITYSASTNLNSVAQRNGGASDLNPCRYYKGSNTNADCLEIGSGVRANGYLTGTGNRVTHTATASIGIYPNNTRLCYVLSVQPRSDDSAGWRHSAMRCLVVQRNYDLVPTITNVTTGDVIEAGAQQRDVTGRVANLGVTKSDPDIAYRMSLIRYLPSTAINSIRNFSASTASRSTTEDPCAFYNNPGAVCTAVPAATGTEAPGYPRVSASGSVKQYPASTTIGADPIGTKYCYVMSVRPHDEANNNWRHSSLHCLVTGKAPKVQVLGGDLYVGRAIDGYTQPTSANVSTSVSRNSTGFYGSWAEYAIAPTGPVVGMHSGSASVVGGVAEGQTSLHLLTLTNTGAATGSCSANAQGCYVHNSIVPSVASRFPVPTGKQPLVSGSLNGITGVFSASGDITISASNIQAGRWVVINAPSRTVTISGNITYANGPFTSAAQIPQVIIIANRINIESGVSNVDAWLIAQKTRNDINTGGVINTCSNVAIPTGATVNVSGVNVNTCNTKLTVNGPVMAHRLHLLRTEGAGAGATAGDPAEVFNFRPDAYLWAYARGQGNDQVTTVSTKELPPRY